tara:strand:- start:1208 stop:1720 length:513 start_codon:yes stop_codon:yes gene_type:complete
MDRSQGIWTQRGQSRGNWTKGTLKRGKRTSQKAKTNIKHGNFGSYDLKTALVKNLPKHASCRGGKLNECESKRRYKEHFTKKFFSPSKVRTLNTQFKELQRREMLKAINLMERARYIAYKANSKRYGYTNIERNMSREQIGHRKALEIERMRKSSAQQSLQPKSKRSLFK